MPKLSSKALPQRKLDAVRKSFTIGGILNLNDKIKPSLEDFGLREDFEIEAYKKRESLRDKKSKMVRKGLSFIITAIFFIWMILKSTQDDLGLEGLLLVTWTALIIFAFSFPITLLLPIKTGFALIDGDFGDAQKVSSFEQALAAWENFSLMTGAGYWQSLRGERLEHEISQLFSEQGWKVNSTPATGDGGIDLFLRKDRFEIWCQCKGHAKPVPVAPVREIAGVCSASEAAPMLIVVNGLTLPARAEAQRLGVIVWDSSDIAAFARGELSIKD